jgi:triphosphatase
LYGELIKLTDLAHQAIDAEVLAARKVQVLAIGSLKAWRQLVK